MRFVKAYICLVLFIGSTLSAYATVHACDGEFKGVNLFTQVECGPQIQNKEIKKCHKSSCCNSKKVEKSTQEGDQLLKDNSCCETEQLIPVQEDYTAFEADTYNEVMILLPTLLSFILPSEDKHVTANHNDYLVPYIQRDITVDLQVFRI